MPMIFRYTSRLDTVGKTERLLLEGDSLGGGCKLRIQQKGVYREHSTGYYSSSFFVGGGEIRSASASAM